MIAPLLAVALSVGISKDLCVPVAPADQVNSELATMYLAVGDEELSSQRPESAVAAYREAVRNDPSNAQAQAKWLALCRDGNSEFDAAVDLMESGKHREAAEKFKAIRAASPDLGAALLEGICRYEIDEDAAAQAALLEAEKEPALTDAARFFLGLVALRGGRTEDAERFFRQTTSSTDPRLQGGALDLLRITKQQARFVVWAQGETGYDSNVSLSPYGDPYFGKDGDAYVGAATALLWHPFRNRGGFLSLSGQYRKQLVLSTYDLGSVSGTAGWLFSSDSMSLGLDYNFDYLAVGGESYLQGHRVQGRLRKSFDSLSLAGTYFLRRENFVRENEKDFSGFRHFGQLEAGWSFAARSAVSLAYRAGIDATDESRNVAFLSYSEHGPAIAASWRIARSFLVAAEVGAWWRTYRDVWPVVGKIRADTVLDGALTGEWFIGSNWSARTQIGTRRVISNIPDQFTFTKISAMVGVSYTTGLD